MFAWCFNNAIRCPYNEYYIYCVIAVSITSTIWSITDVLKGLSLAPHEGFAKLFKYF